MVGNDRAPMSEVDILAEAANAQFRAAESLGTGFVRGVAPAKVNLFLGVGSRRADGRHDVLTVMHTLSLHDTVYVNAEPLAPEAEARAQAAVAAGAQGLAFCESNPRILVSVDMVLRDDVGSFIGASDSAGLSEVAALPASKNLACKAVSALASQVRREEPEHVRIRIEKHIPAQAGLGGGSSDAACVLACLGKLWGVAKGDVLEQAAQAIGTDAPFFLRGGCALYDGAGERFVRSLESSHQPLVVVKPSGGVSTARAYAAFDQDPARASAAMIQEATGARMACEVPLFNGLTKAAEEVQPEVGKVREWLCRQAGIDAGRVLLCGSGSALFAEVDSFPLASHVAAAAKREGLWARPTSCSRLWARGK